MVQPQTSQGRSQSEVKEQVEAEKEIEQMGGQFG